MTEEFIQIYETGQILHVMNMNLRFGIMFDRTVERIFKKKKCYKRDKFYITTWCNDYRYRLCTPNNASNICHVNTIKMVSIYEMT